MPLNRIDYPDPIGHLDFWARLGALASDTKHIAKGATDNVPDRYHLLGQNCSIAMLAVGFGGPSVHWLARHSLGRRQGTGGRYFPWLSHRP
jgi:hypothetical protein